MSFRLRKFVDICSFQVVQVVLETPYCGRLKFIFVDLILPKSQLNGLILINRFLPKDKIENGLGAKFQDAKTNDAETNHVHFVSCSQSQSPSVSQI